jgi:hypothetical protein
LYLLSESINNPYSRPYAAATMKLISENIQLKKEGITKGFIVAIWSYTKQPGTAIKRGRNKPYKTTKMRP